MSGVVFLLTIIRIFGSMFLVFPLVYNEYFLASAFFFIILSITDFFDGFLARKFKVSTHFGSILDPLADKCLFYSTILPLTVNGIVPVFITFGFLIRDLMVGSLREYTQKYDIQIKPNKTGKIKTASVFLTLAGVLLLYPIIVTNNSLLYIVHVIFGFNLLMSIKSFGDYAYGIINKIKFN